MFTYVYSCLLLFTSVQGGMVTALCELCARSPRQWRLQISGSATLMLLAATAAPKVWGQSEIEMVVSMLTSWQAEVRKYAAATVWLLGRR